MIFRGLALASILVAPALAQSDSAWSVNGSVNAEFGYHSVVAKKNETYDIFVNGNDKIDRNRLKEKLM